MSEEEVDPPSPPPIPGGMPFIRNSTATSGFPSAARRHALTEDSGKPSAIRLFTTSAGNSSGELTAEAAAGAPGVVAVAAAAVVAAEAVDVDGPGAAGVVGGLAVAAGVAGTAGVAVASAAAAGVFLA